MQSYMPPPQAATILPPNGAAILLALNDMVAGLNDDQVVAVVPSTHIRIDNLLRQMLGKTKLFSGDELLVSGVGRTTISATCRMQ